MGEGMSLALRSEWLKTRQRLLAQIKRQVHQRLGPEPRELRAYIRRYDGEFSRPWSRSSHEHLHRAIQRADVVLGADFHAFSQSQRIHLRILRELADQRPVILALEAFRAKDQAILDRFMNGEIGEKALLEKTKWDQAWGFPFENYRPLIELAKERGMRLVGVNHHSDQGRLQQLKERDDFAAKVICREKSTSKDALVYVIIGDLHLAANHLPSRIQRRWSERSALDVVTVLQNSEHLYFRLARAGREGSIEVMRAKGGRFCVLGSPPWVKWQSYLMYLEHTYDRDLEAGEMDFTDYVASFAIFIARDLGIEIRLDDLAVYTGDQPKALKHLREKLTRAELSILDHLVESDRSFFIPQTGLLYLSRPSINHAATLAGQYLHARLCQRDRTTWQFPEDFRAAIWIEAVGFFCSKLINHKRKAPSIDEIKRQWAHSRKSGGDREVRSLVLAHWRGERAKARKRSSYMDAGIMLGAILGEGLYRLFDAGDLDLSDLAKDFAMNPFGGDFDAFYSAIWRRVKRSSRAG